MRSADFPTLQLTTTPQMGLLAQEVEQVLPDLVKEMTIAAELDSTGNEINPSVTVKTVNYNQLIPVLIAALQEQNQRMAQMEQDLAQCCALHDGIGTRSMMDEDQLDGDAGEGLQVHPNPFTENTTISYSLKKAGQMQLQVANSAGKVLSILQQGQRDTGEHTYQWNTTDLAPGMYYVTLLQDGKPLMEKAVKVE